MMGSKLIFPEVVEEDTAAPQKTVLVLDTDPGVRWSLAKGLANSGYDVVTASTVAEAVASLRERSTAAVIVELLPEAGLTQDAMPFLMDTVSRPRINCV